MRKLFVLLSLLLLSGTCHAQTATTVGFDQEQTRAMVSGKVPQSSMQVFVLEGRANKPLSLYLMSADSNGRFEVTSPGGDVVATGTADKFGAQVWKGTLTESGTYTIVVYSETGIADFQLTLDKEYPW